MAKLTARRGDTWTRTATALDPRRAPYDFTGATVWWTLKASSDQRNDDTEAVAKLYWVDGGASAGIAIDAPATGVLTVTLTAAQTDGLVPGGGYPYDVQVKKANGDIETIDEGYLSVKPDTTRRTTTP